MLHSTDEGIVVVEVHPNVRQELSDAEANIQAAISIRRGERRQPILVDIRFCEPLEPKVRHFYSGRKLAEAFTAIAIVAAATPFGRMMGNIYLHIANPGIPIQLFHAEDAALEWLRTWLE
jgi:hypothetical protein